MRKLLLRPNSSGYTAQVGNEVVSAATEGGASRTRRDYVGAPGLINVAWMLDEDGFDYLNAFFRTVVQAGSLPFLCDLLLDYAALKEYTCKFVPGSFKPIASTAAFTFNAAAQFEVLPIKPNEAFDLDIVYLFEQFGGHPSSFFNLLEIFANQTMPDNLGPFE